jgi:hypothetical protein
VSQIVVVFFFNDIIGHSLTILRAQRFIRTQELHKAEEQDCGKTSESKVEANTPSHDTPLEGNHGVLQDEGHKVCSIPAWTQEN